MLWLRGGKIMANSSGQPINCDHCPCDDTFTWCCGQKRQVYQTLRLHAVGWREAWPTSLYYGCCPGYAGYDGDYDCDLQKQTVSYTADAYASWPTYLNWYRGGTFAVDGRDSEWLVILSEVHSNTGETTIEGGIGHTTTPTCTAYVWLAIPSQIQTYIEDETLISTESPPGDGSADCDNYNLPWLAAIGVSGSLCDGLVFKLRARSYLNMFEPPDVMVDPNRFTVSAVA